MKSWGANYYPGFCKNGQEGKEMRCVMASVAMNSNSNFGSKTLQILKIIQVTKEIFLP